MCCFVIKSQISPFLVSFFWKQFQVSKIQETVGHEQIASSCDYVNKPNTRWNYDILVFQAEKKNKFSLFSKFRKCSAGYALWRHCNLYMRLYMRCLYFVGTYGKKRPKSTSRGCFFFSSSLWGCEPLNIKGVLKWLG